MGGRLKEGNYVIAGVVPVEVRDFLLEQVKAGRFKTRSKAVRHYLILGIQSQDPEFSNTIESDDRTPKKPRLRPFWRKS